MRNFYRQHSLIAFLVAILIFPPMLAGSMPMSVPHEHNHTHEHALTGELEHSHYQKTSAKSGYSITLNSESLTDCHHTALDGNCSIHCSGGSCSSVSLSDIPQFLTTKSLQHDSLKLRVQDPFIDPFQRPPLFIS